MRSTFVLLCRNDGSDAETVPSAWTSNDKCTNIVPPSKTTVSVQTDSNVEENLQNTVVSSDSSSRTAKDSDGGESDRDIQVKNETVSVEMNNDIHSAASDPMETSISVAETEKVDEVPREVRSGNGSLAFSLGCVARVGALRGEGRERRRRAPYVH
ncbi:hypothetical protein EVAR_76867_1 [Eumeta japonica]|uniref:Uncharacterized protein n=1 Tax=Eumeta variegata TaxID=151549 RepID=A0A4C1SGS2_EUMVA|nr:hypothetical protein EVAR_76867_1 [Eumeta japonica]